MHAHCMKEGKFTISLKQSDNSDTYTLFISHASEQILLMLKNTIIGENKKTKAKETINPKEKKDEKTSRHKIFEPLNKIISSSKN